MSDAGAELGLVFAQPGFQHRKQSSTNGLTRQGQEMATEAGRTTSGLRTHVEYTMLQWETGCCSFLSAL
jgi:hypothetical protein